MMLAPIAFPKWLPSAVAQEAQHLLEAKHSEVALRLATDDRMKFVWRELKKYKVPSGGVYQGELPPGYLPVTWPDAWKDLPLGYDTSRSAAAKYFFDNQLTDQEAALALFFRHAFHYAALDTSAITDSELDKKTAGYKEHAKQLRYSATTMRSICDSDDIKYLGGNRLVRRFASFVERSAELFDALAADTSERKNPDSMFPPITHDHGRREERGYVCALAMVTGKLFCGAKPHTTIATVVNVALDLADNHRVTAKQVENWTMRSKRT
jgi:hypothetical protein